MAKDASLTLTVYDGNDTEVTLTDDTNYTYAVGDMLLVQGEWTNLTHLTADTTNWVVLDQPEKAADKVLLDYKALWLLPSCC